MCGHARPGMTLTVYMHKRTICLCSSDMGMSLHVKVAGLPAKRSEGAQNDREYNDREYIRQHDKLC